MKKLSIERIENRSFGLFMAELFVVRHGRKASEKVKERIRNMSQIIKREKLKQSTNE